MSEGEGRETKMPARIRLDRVFADHGVDLGVANAALIKMNQVGTVTETLQAIRLCQDAGYLPIVSARSGDSEDVTHVHIAVAGNAGQIKNGSWARSCRLCK